jgi:hypothetical protein
MMCEPVNINEGILDSSTLQYYSDDIICHEAGGEIVRTLCGRKLISAVGWWDPAFGHAGGDRSIVAIVYTDEDGQYWLHHLAQIKIDGKSEADEATQQCVQVTKLARQFFIPSIALETNGLGKFLPGILRREMGAAGVACGVREITSRRPKALRIIEAFDAVLAARALHVHRSVLKTQFTKEMEDWKPDKRGGHDDCLDAVAGALSLNPVRIKKTKPADVTGNWVTVRVQPKKVKSEFEV